MNLTKQTTVKILKMYPILKVHMLCNHIHTDYNYIITYYKELTKPQGIPSLPSHKQSEGRHVRDTNKEHMTMISLQTKHTISVQTVTKVWSPKRTLL